MVFFKLISYLLHPLLFSFIGTFLYLYLSPEHILKQQEYIILLIVFVSTYIIPILLLSLLKKVQLINDFHLNTIDERKFPILFFIILSFLIGRTLNHIQIVDLLAYSFFGIAIGLSLTYVLFGLKIKTSLHMLGIGGIVGFLLIMSYYYELNFNALIASLIILSGLIGMARIALEAHKPKEVYIGFLLGILSQWLAFLLHQNI